MKKMKEIYHRGRKFLKEINKKGKNKINKNFKNNYILYMVHIPEPDYTDSN